MTQSPITVTYPLEQILGRIEQKLDKLDEKIDNLQIGQTRLEAELKGEIKTLDARISNLEKTVDDIKTSVLPYLVC